jgi:LPXTG-motif cell wall-anchored protein
MGERVKMLENKIFILFVLTTLCYFFNYPILNVDAKGNVKEIDLQTSPHKIFFEIKNSKPGDTFTKMLTVKNTGTEDIKYLFSNQFLKGSEPLYNELELTIADKSVELYEGKLKDFDKLNPRELKKYTNEELKISVYFPSELGNEFQGLNSEFQFKFYVERTIDGLLPVNGPKLPVTGTNMFNFLAAGAFLVMGGICLFIFRLRRK